MLEYCVGDSRPKRAWLRRVGRLLGYAGVLTAGISLLGAPLARAYAEGAAQRGGLTLLRELGPELVGPPQHLELNGERIWVASKVTPLGVAEVLDSVEHQCKEQSLHLFSELDRIPAALHALLPATDHLLEARAGNAFGQVVCFTDDDAHQTSLWQRARNFAESGDLAAFGRARYVVAQRDADAGNTHVLMLWTEGSFQLRALFPKTGDSPGQDSELVSRPAGSVRLLSARRLDATGALRLYKTDEAPGKVLDAFSRQLSRKGFAAAILPNGSESAALARSARAFYKDGASVIVSASAGFTRGTCVSIVELESLGRAFVAERETP